MSVDKLVDSTQLDSDLTSVANAIRAKSGGSSQLAFPAGFVSEIGNIPSGTEVWQTPYYGNFYPENVEIPSSATYGWTGEMYRDCTHLKSFIAHKGPVTKYQWNNVWRNCSALKTVVLSVVPDNPSVGGSNNVFGNCTSLETVQLGSVGNPVPALDGASGDRFFKNCTQSGLTITIYVDPSKTIPLSGSPWGATNATIIYKSSIDGSVMTP